MERQNSCSQLIEEVKCARAEAVMLTVDRGALVMVKLAKANFAAKYFTHGRKHSLQLTTTPRRWCIVSYCQLSSLANFPISDVSDNWNCL